MGLMVLGSLQWPPVVPSTNALASIATLAVVCTAAAFVLVAALIAEIGPVRATVITYVNPAVAALLGVLVLRETFTVAMAIGFGLVILGSALATRPAARRGPVAADPSGPAGHQVQRRRPGSYSPFSRAAR